MVTTGACFHAGGKYYKRKTVVNTFVIKAIERFGRCVQDPVRNRGRA